ncbi:hypothetical protein [uncultured Rubinisphaera sp.]|uniref:hypothetical protein n=1 Tax=uncultured Rubinisphaera sp. TaxID=1678686 RepID=UPI0030D9F12F|tara:strand:- start:65 stop:271 length:207 start_codon:yes stop_codon:yes gene_type:complete
MTNDVKPRVGYDNVVFTWDGHEIIAGVVATDRDGRLIVSNPHWDDIWHVDPQDARITDAPLNRPPADW